MVKGMWEPATTVRRTLFFISRLRIFGNTILLPINGDSSTILVVVLVLMPSDLPVSITDTLVQVMMEMSITAIFVAMTLQTTVGIQSPPMTDQNLNTQRLFALLSTST